MALDLDLTTKTVIGIQAKHISTMEGTDRGVRFPEVRIYDEDFNSWKTDGTAVKRYGKTSREWHEDGRLVWMSMNPPADGLAGVTAGNHDAEFNALFDRIFDYFEAVGGAPTTRWQQMIFTFKHEPEDVNGADYIAAHRHIWALKEARRGAAKNRIWFGMIFAGGAPRNGGAWTTHWVGAGPAGNQYSNFVGWDPYLPAVDQKYLSDPANPPYLYKKFSAPPAGQSGAVWGGLTNWMTAHCPAGFPVLLGEFGFSHENATDISRCLTTNKGVVARCIWYNSTGTAQDGTNDMVSFLNSAGMKTGGGLPIVKVASYFMYDPTPIRFNIRKTVDPGAFDAMQKALVALDPLTSGSNPLLPPSNFRAGVPTSSSVVLYWDNAVGANGIKIKVYDGDNTAGTLLNTLTKTVGQTSSTIGGVPAGSHRTYQAFSIAADGTTLSVTGSTVITVIFGTSADVTPPTVPTGLAVTSKTKNSITYSWVASTDSQSAVSGYQFYPDGAVASVNASLVLGTSYTLSGLAPSSSHTARVSAVDAAGNESAKTAATAAEVTLADDTIDTTAPGIPASLILVSATDDTLNIAWGAVATGVPVGYRVQVNGVRFADTKLTTMAITRVPGQGYLAPSSSYSLQVQSYDRSGNFSDFCTAVQMSTGVATSASLPVIRCTTDPSAGLVGTQYFKFDVSSSYSPQGSSPVSYMFDWDDGSVPVGPYLDSVIYRRFQEWGTHLVKITAIDAGGRVSRTLVVPVDVNPEIFYENGLKPLYPHSTLDIDTLNDAFLGQIDANLGIVYRSIGSLQTQWSKEVLLGTPTVVNNILPPGISVDIDTVISRIRVRCNGTITGAGLQIRVNAITDGVSTAIGTVTVPISVADALGYSTAEGVFAYSVAQNDSLTFDVIAVNGATNVAVLIASE